MRRRGSLRPRRNIGIIITDLSNKLNRRIILFVRHPPKRFFSACKKKKRGSKVKIRRRTDREARRRSVRHLGCDTLPCIKASGEFFFARQLFILPRSPSLGVAVPCYRSATGATGTHPSRLILGLSPPIRYWQA